MICYRPTETLLLYLIYHKKLMYFIAYITRELVVD